MLGLLMHDGTVGGFRRLAKVEEEARLGGLVVAAPLVPVAQLLLVVRRVRSWRRQRRVSRSVGVLLQLIPPGLLLALF